MFFFQVLAYLDADMELCVLDTRAGTELEHASLSTLGVSMSPILPPPPSSQPPFVAPGETNATNGTAGGGKPEAGKGGGDSDLKVPVPTASAMGTYHNAFRASEGRLYLLGRQELRAVRVQGWSQRVESLVQAGEWLEALAVALDHYEQKILPAENAAAAAAVEAAAVTAAVVAASDGGEGGGGSGEPAGASGIVPGGSASRGSMPVGGGGGRDWDAWGGGGSGGFEGSKKGVVVPGLGLRVGDKQQPQQQRRSMPRSEAAEHISDLLAQYLRLAINNAPAAEPSSGLVSGGGSGGGGGGGRINLAHSHFQMLAGVCMEFCAVTGRLDMLYGQVFQAFRARGQQG